MTEAAIGKAKARPGERPRPSVQDVLSQDSKPAPDILRLESPAQGLGSEDIPIERYFSQEWHDREVEKVWRKVWQVACREEEIPNVGDHIVYEIADESLIVARTAPDTIRAYVNACLHRGVLLRTEGGHVDRFKCPFHGFTWGLDGQLSHIPSAWDFEHIDPDTFCLPQAKVGLWGGFVFVNFDPNCESLESYLEILPAHFEGYPLEKHYKAAHVAKIMPCNWKLANEAFIESLHIHVAHPQTSAYVGDENTQYDVFPGVRHVNRMITLEGVPSPFLGEVSGEETVRQMQRDMPFYAGTNIELAPGEAPREKLAEAARAKIGKSSGRDLSDVSNCEVIDVIEYFLFPNLAPWRGHGVPICYRFRPYGNNPEMSIMEIMLLFAKAEDGSHPKPPPVTWLGVDDNWSDAPGLGSAGFVADQDTSNLKRIQRGLRTMRKPGITLANYQESRIRHFHKTLEHYMEA